MEEETDQDVLQEFPDTSAGSKLHNKHNLMCNLVGKVVSFGYRLFKVETSTIHEL